MADENKRYIKINKFSQNNYKDRADPTGDNGEFNKIKNYIPSPRKIETRKGVSEYSYSHPPTIDPACIMWLKFDGVGSYRDCEVNGENGVYWSNKYQTSAITVDAHEGTHALHVEADKYNGVGNWIVNLDDTFPGNTASATDFLFACWVKIVQSQYETRCVFGRRLDGYTNQLASMVQDSNKSFHFIVWTDGGNFRAVDSDNDAFTEGGGYVHLTCWYSTTLKKMGVRVSNAALALVSNQTHTWVDAHLPYKSSYQGFAVGGGIYVVTSQGGYWTTQIVKESYIDDFYVLNDLPATEAAILTKIDNIRDGNHYSP